MKLSNPFKKKPEPFDNTVGEELYNYQCETWRDLQPPKKELTKEELEKMEDVI